MNKDSKITLIASIGMFLSTFDTGIVSISITDISNYFRTDSIYGSYILTSYAIMLCGSLLAFGVLSSKKGNIKVFNFGLVFFMFSSLLCASASSMFSLVIFRGFQGLSAAMIQATAIALVIQYISSAHKMKSIATVISVAGIGPILAPAAGGFIINFYSWQWLFLINVPICIICLIISLPIKNVIQPTSNINKINIVLYSILMITIICGLTINTWIFMFVIILSTLIFYIEYKYKNGILNNLHITQWQFYLSLIGSLFLGLSTSVMFIIPPMGLLISNDIFLVSIISLSLPVLMVLTSKISPYFISKYDYGKVFLIGIMLMSIGVSLLLTGNFSIIQTTLSLSTFGIGCGLLQPSGAVMLFNSTNVSYHSLANSLSRVSVNMGIAIGSSLTAILIASNIIV